MSVIRFESAEKMTVLIKQYKEVIMLEFFVSKIFRFRWIKLIADSINIGDNVSQEHV